MICNYQKDIYRYADREVEGLDRHQLQKHMQDCVACQKEFKSIQKLNDLIRVSASSIESSSNFDAAFWQKVAKRESQPAFLKFLHHLDSLIPTPSLAQAFAILLIALLIGGTGGFVATANTISPERIRSSHNSVQYLSGFQEFGGLPSSSVAASYLKTGSNRNAS